MRSTATQRGSAVHRAENAHQRMRCCLREGAGADHEAPDGQFCGKGSATLLPLLRLLQKEAFQCQPSSKRSECSNCSSVAVGVWDAYGAIMRHPQRPGVESTGEAAGSAPGQTRAPP